MALLLTPEQQIEHLRAKGVRFELCPEAEAEKYLLDRMYFFKIAAYRTLFEKRVGAGTTGSTRIATSDTRRCSCRWTGRSARYTKAATRLGEN